MSSTSPNRTAPQLPPRIDTTGSSAPALLSPLGSRGMPRAQAEGMTSFEYLEDSVSTSPTRIRGRLMRNLQSQPMTEATPTPFTTIAQVTDAPEPSLLLFSNHVQQTPIVQTPIAVQPTVIEAVPVHKAPSVPQIQPVPVVQQAPLADAMEQAYRLRIQELEDQLSKNRAQVASLAQQVSNANHIQQVQPKDSLSERLSRLEQAVAVIPNQIRQELTASFMDSLTQILHKIDTIPTVDLQPVHDKIESLRVAPVDLKPVLQKIDSIPRVDLKPILDKIAAIPKPVSVDLQPVYDKIDSIPPAVLNVDLQPVLAKIDSIPQPIINVDLQPIVEKIDSIPQPIINVDLQPIVEKIDSIPQPIINVDLQPIVEKIDSIPQPIINVDLQPIVDKIDSIPQPIINVDLQPIVEKIEAGMQGIGNFKGLEAAVRRLSSETSQSFDIQLGWSKQLLDGIKHMRSDVAELCRIDRQLPLSIMNSDIRNMLKDLAGRIDEVNGRIEEANRPPPVPTIRSLVPHLHQAAPQATESKVLNYLAQFQQVFSVHLILPESAPQQEECLLQVYEDESASPSTAVEQSLPLRVNIDKTHKLNADNMSPKKIRVDEQEMDLFTVISSPVDRWNRFPVTRFAFDAQGTSAPLLADKQLSLLE
jgi:hypothetical protein